MKCFLKNHCATSNRCCHFCKSKSCWQRCNDEYKRCQWFSDENDEETQKTIDRTDNAHFNEVFMGKRGKKNG